MKGRKKTTLKDIYLLSKKSRKMNSATFGEFICDDKEEIDESDIKTHVINTLIFPHDEEV